MFDRVAEQHHLADLIHPLVRLPQDGAHGSRTITLKRRRDAFREPKNFSPERGDNSPNLPDRRIDDPSNVGSDVRHSGIVNVINELVVEL
jgi:hypothetical protein